jgi:ribonuclease HI
MLSIFTPLQKQLFKKQLFQKQLFKKQIKKIYKLQFGGQQLTSTAIIYENNKELWNSSVFIGNKTNIFSEYTGLIIGLKKAYELNIKNLHIESNSDIVIEQMKNNNNLISECMMKKYEIAKIYESKFDSVKYNNITCKLLDNKFVKLSNNAIEEHIKIRNIFITNLHN